MPSDEPTRRALDALLPRADRYRIAIGQALTAMREHLSAHRAQHDGGAARAALELGRFADGRIDGGRYASLFTGARILDPGTMEGIERCAAVLAELQGRGDALFVRDVPAGGDVHRVVGAALADIGRAFGAVLAFQALRTGVHRAEQHDAGLSAFPFARWNHGERRLAPPLVIGVDGPELRAESVVEFLDGTVCLVFVVRGDAAAAPLARLATPGTFVLQTASAEELDALRGFDGPAVAAVLPTSAARFAHDPRAGGTLAERLVVTNLPSDPPRQTIGGLSAWQQRDALAHLGELARLAELARRPRQVPASPGASPPAAPAAAPDPAPAMPASAAGEDGRIGALADWLLAQAGLDRSADGAGRGTT